MTPEKRAQYTAAQRAARKRRRERAPRPPKETAESRRLDAMAAETLPAMRAYVGDGSPIRHRSPIADI